MHTRDNYIIIFNAPFRQQEDFTREKLSLFPLPAWIRLLKKYWPKQSCLNYWAKIFFLSFRTFNSTHCQRLLRHQHPVRPQLCPAGEARGPERQPGPVNPRVRFEHHPAPRDARRKLARTVRNSQRPPKANPWHQQGQEEDPWPGLIVPSATSTGPMTLGRMSSTSSFRFP